VCTQIHTMDNCQYTYEYLRNYRIEQLLGKSDLSEVFLAYNENDHSQVALKLLYGRWTGESAEKFQTQTAAFMKLDHPHIVPILDFGIQDDVAFLAMKYAPHGSLRQRYPKGTRIPLETVIHLVKQIVQALHYLHERGLVHRDIKPHNLLIGPNNEIMLSDFGATITSHSLSPIIASLREFEGTTPYAAPEQLQGKPSRSSDQYALGIMVYEWLSGEWPFNGSFYEITHQHLFVAPPSFKESGLYCPENVEKVILRTLEKDKAKRFPSVKRFAEELEWSYKIAQAKGLLTDPEVPAPPQAVRIQTQGQATSTKKQFKSPLNFKP
jgi:serine/threonine protein kinase